MSSENQIKANKLNSQRSTGPRTPEGKRRVASNALKHGLTGRQIVLSNENPEDFDEYRSALLNELDPQGALEEVVADKIVADAWRARRVPALEAALYAQDFQHINLLDLRAKRQNLYVDADPDSVAEVESLGELLEKRMKPRDREEFDRLEGEIEQAERKDKDPIFAVTRALEKHARQFDNLSRYEESLTRSMLRGLHELQRLQAARRAGEQVAAPAAFDVNVHVDLDDGGALPGE